MPLAPPITHFIFYHICCDMPIWEYGVRIWSLITSLLDYKFTKSQWRRVTIYKLFSLWANSPFSRQWLCFKWFNFILGLGKLLINILLNFRMLNFSILCTFHAYFSYIVLYSPLLYFKAQGKFILLWRCRTILCL